MTYSTQQAATSAGCSPLTARRLGVAMKGRPHGAPLWTQADIRHLTAAITLAQDSPEHWFTDDELVRMTRGARHGFVHYIVIRGRTGIGVRDLTRVRALVGASKSAARVIVLQEVRARAVAS